MERISHDPNYQVRFDSNKNDLINKVLIYQNIIMKYKINLKVEFFEQFLIWQDDDQCYWDVNVNRIKNYLITNDINPITSITDEQDQQITKDILFSNRFMTGLNMKVVLHNQCPFITNHPNSWMKLLSSQFCLSNTLGPMTDISIQSAQDTFTIYVDIPKSILHNDQNFLRNVKMLLERSDQNILDHNNILSVNRDRKNGDRIYIKFSGNPPQVKKKKTSLW